jgi:hypothetical protein
MLPLQRKCDDHGDEYRRNKTNNPGKFHSCILDDRRWGDLPMHPKQPLLNSDYLSEAPGFS